MRRRNCNPVQPANCTQPIPRVRCCGRVISEQELNNGLLINNYGKGRKMMNNINSDIQNGQGRGQGRGIQNGQGQGQGQGRGMQNGQGQGQGRGMQNGQGQGQGRGMQNGQR